ncbi:hypothetical protein HDK90DRAFT_120477 [Phyllosticta capitalensis]|uniref:Uncharacterized protein n=1 Tax=Phyllosticta capitalensis TaxID=121624 RepID=A0ABR1Y8U6_9PEZI
MANGAAPSPAGGSHYDLSQAYWSIRMHPSEKIDAFIARVHALERRLGYSTRSGPGRHLGPQATIDLWLARVSPHVLEQLKRETGQRMDFESEGHLLDVIRKIEFDERVEAVRSYRRMRIDWGEAFHDFQARIAEAERQLGYDTPDRDAAAEKRLIDAWLVRLSRAHCEKLRRYTNGLEEIDTEEQLLEILLALDHVDDGETGFAQGGSWQDEESDTSDDSESSSDGYDDSEADVEDDDEESDTSDGSESSSDSDDDAEAGVEDWDDDAETDVEEDGQVSDAYQSAEEQQEDHGVQEITQDDVKREEVEEPSGYVMEYQSDTVEVKQEDDSECEIIAGGQQEANVQMEVDGLQAVAESVTPGGEDARQNHAEVAIRMEDDDSESEDSSEEGNAENHNQQEEPSTPGAHQSGQKKRKQKTPSSVGSSQSDESRQAWSALQERRRRSRQNY